MNSIKKIFSRFFTETKGAVAIVFTIIFIFVVLGLLSLVIDVNRAQTSYAKGQSATDSAALGLAELIQKGIFDRFGTDPNAFNFAPSQSDMESYATSVLLKNFALDQTSGVFDPLTLKVLYERNIPNTKTGKLENKITVTACANVQSPLSETAKHGNVQKTCTTSTAAFTIAKLENLQVAFALDFTNSMYWAGEKNLCTLDTVNSTTNCPTFANTKAKALVDTMDFVFDNYFRNDQASTIYGSIIPYTSFVNLYPYSKTMVNQKSLTSTPPTVPKITNMTTLVNFKNLSGSSYYNASTISNFAVEYKNDMAHVLDHIPVILNDNQFSSMISATDSSSALPFPSYVEEFTGPGSLQDRGVSDAQRVNLCYNSAILAGLDQRIERIEEAVRDTPAINSAGMVTTPVQTYTYQGKNWRLSEFNRYRTRGRTTVDLGIDKRFEYHESYPIQPLTNNPAILKGIVERLTGATPLFNNNPAQTASNGVVDRQRFRLNRASDVTGGGTSSVQGLLWAWYTVSKDWVGKWNDKSLHEQYYSSLGTQSLNSRLALNKNDDQLRNIILITDGHDNDGETNQLVCDAYAPVGKLSDAQYLALCDRIKADGIRIHTLLLDFNEPGSQRYSKCSSENSFYENVQPNQLKSIMDQVFKSIISDLFEVHLVK